MNFDLKKFEKQIPGSFHPLLDELLRRGYSPTLVGGSVRDFFLTGVVGKDWDIELNHPSMPFDKNQWKDLGKDLSAFGKMTFLPYEIIRLENGDHQFELSPPRKEIFTEENHHSNFTAEFDYRLPFSEAIKRRDFTVNSMGIKFNSKKDFEVLDPLEGQRHLFEKVLHPAGPDFYKDPVRFLRAIRFALKLGFTYSKELEEQLQKMQVKFSPTYLWNEMQKSGDPVNCLRNMLKATETHPEIKLPLSINDLRRFDDLKKVIMDPSRHEAWMIALEWMGVNCESWSQYFGLSSDTCRKIGRWAASSRYFQGMFPELYQGNFENVRDTEEFEKLFDWYFTTKQIMQKNPELPILNMVQEFLPEWIHLYRFEAPKDIKHIDPPYRAKYQVWSLCQRI